MSGAGAMPNEGAPAWLLLLYGSRFGASLAFMMYAGALHAVIADWGMSASEAGSIQTGFNIAYALSLVATSWLADRIGAKRVLLWSSWIAGGLAVAFALFAHSFLSGFLLFVAMGLAQGGTYSPSIMLVAQGIAPGRRGAAVGWLLAAASLGYFGSTAIATALSSQGHYRLAFLLCAGGTLMGALSAWMGLRRQPNLIAPRLAAAPSGLRFLFDRRSLLLTLGYTTHCWELLGMWAWMPAFLTAALGGAEGVGAALQGLGVAAIIHISGAISSFTMGHASDRLGRRAVLVAMGIAGALCSFTVGWTASGPLLLLLPLAAFYGFSALGDSAVLSVAMTESVDAGSLGLALAVRSILGFGAGGLAPLVFGTVLDIAGGAQSWGWAFAALGVGGTLATVCALNLPRDRPAAAQDASFK